MVKPNRKSDRPMKKKGPGDLAAVTAAVAQVIRTLIEFIRWSGEW